MCILCVFPEVGYLSKWIHFISSSLYLSSLSPSIRTSAFKLNESESFDFNPCALSSVLPPYQTDLDYLRSSSTVSSLVRVYRLCLSWKASDTSSGSSYLLWISAPRAESGEYNEPTGSPLHPLANWDTALLHKLKAEDTMNQQEVPPPFGQLRHSGRQEEHPGRPAGRAPPLSRLLAQQGTLPTQKRAHGCRRAPTAVRQRRALPPTRCPCHQAGWDVPKEGAGIWLFPGLLSLSSLITDITCALWSWSFPTSLLNPFPLTSQSLPLP